MNACTLSTSAPQHASTPSPHHPSTPAPQHAITPAPQHPITPSPQHASTPSPHHPITPAPRHPVTPARQHPVTPSPHHPITPSPQHPVTPSPQHASTPTSRANFVDRLTTRSKTSPISSFNLLDSVYQFGTKHGLTSIVLITKESVKVLHEVRQIIPVMRRLTMAKMTGQQTLVMGGILDKLASYCVLTGEPREPHAVNQAILYNHDIINLVFNILCQEIDIRLENQYKTLIEFIFCKCFRLLKGLARGNSKVQLCLFERVDQLLAIRGAEAEMAEAVIQVFTGNKHTDLNISSNTIEKIMQLVAEHRSKVPQFLDLLHAIVKMEYLNVPLKKNQADVMKYFLQYRESVGHVIDGPLEDRTRLLQCPDNADHEYYIALVGLFAACAEGGSEFIESLCKTIFSVDEVLAILSDETMVSSVKRPYLLFLLWVYMKASPNDTDHPDLVHEHLLWRFFGGLTTDLNEMTSFISKHTYITTQMLKRPPGGSCRGRGDEETALCVEPNSYTCGCVIEEQTVRKYYNTLFYVLDAAMPFLQVFFCNHYVALPDDFPREDECVQQLANATTNFALSIGDLVDNEYQINTMITTVNAMFCVTTMPEKTTEQFQTTYGHTGVVRNRLTEAMKTYTAYYEREETLNELLHVYTSNCRQVYGGFNDVKTQIGFPSDNEYIDVSGNEVLPLGREFQNFVDCFVDSDERPEHHKKHRNKYRHCSKLILKLYISTLNTDDDLSEQERARQELLDVRCLQLLRATIHNEIVKLPDDWQENTTGNASQLRKIERLQKVLLGYHAIDWVLPHLGRQSDTIVREVLAFLAALLFGANKHTQVH
ncbi:hypothetical protein LSAT2_000247 [Lamellibrachia satsuma]|nr:hypothetical protein LSAT2_000247 [Lamellibrachia satsuma]